MAAPDLVLLDDDGSVVSFEADDAAALLELTGGLDAATVSACPDCRARVLAAVALLDVLADAQPVPHGGDLAELAEDSPTLHLYVRDLATRCRHPRWRDPGREEWTDVIIDLVGRAARSG